MTHNSFPINRRTVLKGIGITAGAGLLGPSAFSRGAAASSSSNPDDFRFYAITPSTTASGAPFPAGTDVPQYLITIDPADGSTEVVSEIQFNGPVNGPNLQTPSLSFHPNGKLYGIAIRDNYVYEIDPNTGVVTLLGDDHRELRYIWGTTFTSDGVYHGVRVQDSLSPPVILEGFYSPIDYTESGGSTDAPVFVDELKDADGNVIDAVHTGLTTNQSSDVVYATLGNRVGGAKDEVYTIDVDTGEVTRVATDVFAADRLVGAELNPCTGELFVIRNGRTLLSIDLATGVETVVKSPLTFTVNGNTMEVRADNLAAKWVDCAAGCTRTIGYYKTHGFEPKGNNENVVQQILDATGSIWLGLEGDSDSIEVVDSEDAAEILDVSGPKNDDEMLKAQLLAAKLNIRDGADQSDILEIILKVDRYLAGELSADDSTVEKWKDELDDYNNGLIGPGHCDDDEEKEEEKEKEEKEKKEKDDNKRGKGRGRD